MKKLIFQSIFCLGFVLYGSNLHAITLKIATLAPNGSSWLDELKNGARVIKEKTDGRVKIKFYPGGVMGNDQTVHRKIRINQLQGGAFSSSGLSQINTAIQALSLPMMFHHLEEVDYVRNQVDHRIRENMRQSGYEILGITEGGFARIMSTRPIHTLDDIRQRKVWSPEGDTLVNETYDTMGIQAVPLPMSDVYTGLQTGMIDTIASTSTGAIAFQWHSKLNSIVDLPVLYVIGVLAVSNEAFARINPEDQTIVIEEMNKVFSKLNTLNRNSNKEAMAALKHQGFNVFVPSEKDVDELREVSKVAINRMIDKGLINQSLINEINAALRDYRIRKNL